MTLEYWLILIVPLMILSMFTYITAYYLAKNQADYIGFAVIGGMISKMMMFLGILAVLSSKTKLAQLDIIYMLIVYFVLSFVLVIVILPLLKTINVKKESK